MIEFILRKKKALLLIVFFSIGAAFLYHYGFFSRYNYITAKIDIKKRNVRLISVTPFWESYVSVMYLSKKHNIEVEWCNPVFLINNITDKGIDIYNQQMEKQIKINLGEKAYKKYQKELDSLYKQLAIQLSPIEYPKNQ